jgi:8-oxo-dGTP diphosphatase
MSFRKNWFQLPVAVMIVILRDDQVLLSQRKNTGFKDGFFALPGGKHDGNEVLSLAVAREAQEELGISCQAEQVQFASLIHAYLPEPPMELLYATFKINQFQGEIINNEPHKCAELKFFPLSHLPENITCISRQCILNTIQGVPFSEYGW